jgi:Arc/MetJ family transcription regulator
MEKTLEYGVWPIYHTRMKMTMNIDDAVLAEVMEITGIDSKTGAVERALKEMARRSKLKKLLREGMGLTADEIGESYDFEGYDRMNHPTRYEMAMLAEPVKKYGSKSSAR